MQTIGCTGYGPSPRKLYEGAQIIEHGTLKSSSQRLAESCLAVNIMVIIMKLWNCRFSVIKGGVPPGSAPGFS